MGIKLEQTKEIAGSTITRRQLRYILYRIKNELDGGALANEDAETISIKTYFEALEEFGGWEYFSVLWDVGPPGYHHRIVERKESKAKEWQDKLDSLTKTPEMASSNLDTMKGIKVNEKPITDSNLEALKEIRKEQ